MHSDDPDYWCVADALTPELHGGRSVCVSQYLAKQLQQQVGATKPLVIPCGIALPLGLTSFSDQPFRVVYSGRMVERQKCIHQVVQALILACEASSQIEALLFGDGPARSACEQLVHQAGFADRIRFYGRVPPDQVQWYLQSSQAILLMSEFEGLPVALLEAMATGVVPVVRAIDSGIPELVQHERTGLLVTNDPAQAASALVRLCREPQLWHQCSTQARTHVQNSYNSEHCVQRWMELIQEAREPVPLSFPIDKLNFRKELPWGDLRFQAHYTPSPSRWSKLRPRRLIGRLRRMAVGHSPSEGS
jgi:colanic acid/amylovoran biosynthesis glycosyltransferase